MEKIFRPPKLNVKLILKTISIAEKKMPINDTLEMLLREYNKSLPDTPARQHDSLIFPVRIGESNINIQLSFISISDDDENEIIDQIMCSLEHLCSYRSFDKHIYEMREAQKKVETVMRKNIVEFTDNVILECKLNELYELTSILEKSSIDTISSTIGTGGTQFDLFKNKLTVFGKEINDEILSLMKQMITIYY